MPFPAPRWVVPAVPASEELGPLRLPVEVPCGLRYIKGGVSEWSGFDIRYPPSR